MICKEILFSDHAISQMFKRNISVNEVKTVVANGERLISYTFDKPYPSYLLFGFINKRPLHVIVAKHDVIEKCIIVTTYEPDETVWQQDFRAKRK